MQLTSTYSCQYGLDEKLYCYCNVNDMDKKVSHAELRVTLLDQSAMRNFCIYIISE